MTKRDNLTLALFGDPETATATPAVSEIRVVEESTPMCDWSQFVLDNGRVPMISDDRKPWTYKGWLMHYRFLMDEHLDIPKRWDYWARTMQAGKLLDEPIPRISFTSRGLNSQGEKLLTKWVEIVEVHGRGWSSLSDLMDWLLFGFGLADELPKVFDDRLNEKLYREVNIQPLVEQPADYFGAWIAERKSSKWNTTGFYPTPHEVCEMMCQMNFPEGEDYRAKTVCDPALGTGRMLLHASNHSLRLYGNDIDINVLKACKINGALYAPWMVKPFPEVYFA
jgi:hypothetical protein